ncbi:hypothetical protein [Streptomyces sp. MUM 178J]|uniref:hypothetical protein n=1 Tax=Streptomyces sp. MUM 178J TaxID=2791991 RepID=UPI001F04FD14|nr:hypothetical protein [Streptomyces sp. MUM 178J]WRQ80886.1 hypothetical protein I3F59_016815 [Streptomyces sp. MUM 178J]
MANLREQVDMTDPIRVLAVRARLLYRSRVDGRHHARVAVLAYRPAADGPAALMAAARRMGPPRLPTPQSIYGLDAPLDGDETALVRPYVVAWERWQERSRQQRLTLALAADFGLGRDAHAVGAGGVR